MNNNFYQVGGSLPASSKAYIIREADRKLYDYLKENRYCYILNARQVGKSSLRVRTSNRLAHYGYRCVNIDITFIGSQNIKVEEWYFSLILEIVEQLELDIDTFIDYWDSMKKITIIHRFSKIIDKILNDSSENIIIFLDEIDSILGIDIFSADDFFAVIRTFYNLRSEDAKYNRLSFAIFGVATAEDLMRDSSRTPFNIAHSITLNQLRFSESMPLIEGLDNQSIESKQILKKVFDYTSGTPYLTQKILDYISSNPIKSIKDIDNIVDELFIQKNFEETNISNIQIRIISDENYNIKMLHLISNILNSQVISKDNDLTQIYLKLSGLVKTEDGKLVYNNKIYKMLFDQSWVDRKLSKTYRPFYKDLKKWEKNGKKKSELLENEALVKARKWADSRDDLSKLEKLYLQKSEKEENRRINLKSILLTATIAIILISILIYSILVINAQRAINDQIIISNKTERKKLINKSLNSTYNFDCNYTNLVIPNTLNSKINQDKNYSILLTKYDITGDKIKNDKNKNPPALIWLILNTEKYSYQEKIFWINNLKYLDSKQKKLLFEKTRYEAYISKADEFNKNQKFDASIKSYEIAKSINKRKNIDKKISDAYFNWGNNLYKKEEYEDAIEKFKKATHSFSQNSDAYYYQGKSYMKLKKYDNAIEKFNDTLKINNKHTKVYDSITNAYIGKGDDEKNITRKIEIYTKALDNNNSTSRDKIYYHIGKAYENVGNDSKALESYKAGKEYNSDNSELNTAIERQRLKLYNDNQHKEKYSQSVDKYKKDKSYSGYYRLATFYRERKEYNKAIDAYKKAIEKKNNYYYAYYDLGNTYRDIADYGNAVKSYNAAININDKAYYAHCDLGVTYRYLKDYSNAIDQYKKAIDIDKKNDDAYRGLGIIYLKIEEYSNALDNFKKATELNPKHFYAYFGSGKSYNGLKEYEKAIEMYKKAIKYNSKFDEIYYYMGIAYEKQKKYNLAEKSYQEAIQINSDNQPAKEALSAIGYKKPATVREIIIENSQSKIIVNYPNYIQNGKSFTINATMYNNYKNAKSGGLTLSFPQLNTSAGVKKDGDFRTTKLYEKESKIYNNKTTKIMSAEYLAIEGWEDNWKQGSRKSFQVKINNLPQISELKINIRGILNISNKKKKEIIANPSKGSIYDQQGYNVETISIPVINNSVN